MRWITTSSGARIQITRSEDTHLWYAWRDDGVLIFRSYSLMDVQYYIERYGDVIDPGKGPFDAG